MKNEKKIKAKDLKPLDVFKFPKGTISFKVLDIALMAFDVSIVTDLRYISMYKNNDLILISS